jgi:hypothetical protein
MKITTVSCGRWILTTAVHELGTTYALTELDLGQEEIGPMSREATEPAEAVAELLRKIGSVV